MAVSISPNGAADKDLPAPIGLIFPPAGVPITIIASVPSIPEGALGAGQSGSTPPTGGAEDDQKLDTKGKKSDQKEDQLPPEVQDFYKDASTPEGEQIPAEELLRMYKIYTRFIKGKPQFGKGGEFFTGWVDFLDKNSSRLKGQMEITKTGKLKLDMLEGLAKKLKEGQRLEFPDDEEKALAARAKKAREEEGTAGNIAGKPEWLLMPEADRKLLLQVMEKHPDLFTGPAGQSEVDGLTVDMKRALGLQIASKYIPGETGEALLAMVTSWQFWAMLAGTIAAYVLLWLLPEPFSKIAAGTLTAFLLIYFGVDTIISFANAWSTLNDAVKYDAKTGPELEAAAKRYAHVLGEIDAQVLVAIATWLVGRAAGKAAKAIKGKGKTPPGEFGKAGEGKGSGEGLKKVEGEMKPAEAEVKPAEGEAKPKEGEAKPKEGEAKPAEAEVKPAEGDAIPKEGEAKPAEGETKADEGKSRRARILEQTRNRLADVETRKLKNRAEYEDLSDKISQLEKSLRELKERIKGLKGEERTKALEEMRSRQEELDGFKDERLGNLEEKAKLDKSEEGLLEGLALKRPSLWETTKKIIRDASRTLDGKFRDPHRPGKVIEGEWDYGHKYGRENRRLILEATEKGMTQEQFNRWVNEHPEWFQIEGRPDNISHAFEKSGID